MTSKSNPVSLDWTKHLRTEKDREDFVTVLRNSTYITGRLADILRERLDSVYREETKLGDFSDPNWSHKQAFRNGRKQVLKEVLDLLSFTTTTKDTKTL